MLDPRRVGIEPRRLDERVATLSIDVETDFGSGRVEALSKIDRFLDLMGALGVPVTAFVEGQFFENRRALCRLLLDRGADVQLHCYDHGLPGDTPESLRRGAAAYADLVGRPPRGYRAHTYRLTEELFETLVEAGFRWDSSVMTAFAQGRNPHPEFKRGDYFLLGGRLVEFPIGTWGRLPIALNHTHRLLVKRPAEAVLRAAFGPSRLVAYNVHMTDLVRCDSLRSAARSPLVRLLYRYLWCTQGGDTFKSLTGLVEYLRRLGFAFRTTDDLHRRVTSTAPGSTRRA